MTVTIYTKHGCPYCAKAKEAFRNQKKEFTEINVTEQPDKIADLVKAAGIRKVPVVIENDTVTVGYNGGG